jgi:predicted ATP-grasp superfamily ATP-dependent carboligase
MGACITRQRNEHEYQQQRTIIESTVKPETINEESNTRRNTQEYNKLLMEHLEKNKESLDVIAKSLTVLSNLNTPKSIRSCNSINNNKEQKQIIKECNNCKCKTKLKNLKMPCSKVRSINLVKRKNKHKHKRYLIEISDSSDLFENNKNFTDDDIISNSSTCSASTTTSSNNNNNNDEKLHIKLTKLKVNK